MTSVAVLDTAICDFLRVGCAAIEDVDARNKSGQGFFGLRRHIRPETNREAQRPPDPRARLG